VRDESKVHRQSAIRRIVAEVAEIDLRVTPNQHRLVTHVRPRIASGSSGRSPITAWLSLAQCHGSGGSRWRARQSRTVTFHFLVEASPRQSLAE
jgi:hypothetical protein